MPPALLERLKPTARARTHLLAAAAMWTLVGTGLGVAGVVWCLASPMPTSLLLIAVAIALGQAKARWVLSRVARRNAARIAARGDGRCLGGFVSWQSWLFIGGMMGGGYLLRHSPVPLPVLGVVYAGVGTALIVGSAILWRAVGG